MNKNQKGFANIATLLVVVIFVAIIFMTGIYVGQEIKAQDSLSNLYQHFLTDIKNNNLKNNKLSQSIFSPCDKGRCGQDEICYSGCANPVGPPGPGEDKKECINEGDLLCHPLCDNDSDCPDGSTCQTVSYFLGDVGGRWDICL